MKRYKYYLTNRDTLPEINSYCSQKSIFLNECNSNKYAISMFKERRCWRWNLFEVKRFNFGECSSNRGTFLALAQYVEREKIIRVTVPRGGISQRCALFFIPAEWGRGGSRRRDSSRFVKKANAAKRSRNGTGIKAQSSSERWKECP